MCYESAKIFHVPNLVNALKWVLLGVYVIYFGNDFLDRCRALESEVEPLLSSRAFNDKAGYDGKECGGIADGGRSICCLLLSLNTFVNLKMLFT